MNNFAISSQSIGEALKRSASALAAAGNNLDESIGLITGMNAVLQDAVKTGTTLKSLTMFLRAAKTEAEEAGEATDGMASSVSELRDELLTITKGKLDIMIDDTTFKSTYQIMKELSEIWDDIVDVDKANILELIAGKRNATAVTSLLTNFKDAEAAMIASQESAGSAIAENEKYLDSIAGKIGVVQAKFEAFSTSLISSGLVKFIIDAGGVGLNILNFIQKLNATLPVLLIVITAIVNKVNSIKVSLVAQSIIGQVDKLTGSIDAQDVAVENLRQSVSGLSLAQKDLLRVQLMSSAEFRNMSPELQAQNLQVFALNSSLGTFRERANGFVAGIKGMWSSGLGLMLVITAVISLLTLVAKTMDTLRDNASKAKDEYDSALSELEKVNQKIEENGKLIEELNANPLDITNKDTLETLKDENIELAAQKVLLEDIAKAKGEKANKSAEKFLDNSGFSGYLQNLSRNWKDLTSGNHAEYENQRVYNTKYGKETAKVLYLGLYDGSEIVTASSRSIVEQVNAAVTAMGNLVSQRNEIYEDGILSDDEIKKLAEINTELELIRKNLALDFEEINNSKDGLSKDSELYQEITQVQTRYSKLLTTINESPVSTAINMGFEQAREKIEKSNFLSYMPNVSMPESLEGYFDRNYLGEYTIGSNNLYGYRSQLEKIIQTLKSKVSLSDTELAILNDTEAEYKRVTKVIREYDEAYVNGLSEEARVKFESFEKDNPSKFVDSKPDFYQWREDLTSLAGENSKLEDILWGMANAAFPQFSSELQKLEVELPSTSAKVAELTKDVDTLRESIEGIRDNNETYNSAIDSMAAGKSIKYDDMMGLVELDPSLAKDVITVADGYRIAENRLIESRNSYASEQRTGLQTQLDDLIKARDESKKLIGEYQSRIEAMSGRAQSADDARILADLNNALELEQQNYLDASNSVDVYRLSINALDTSLHDEISTFSELENSLSLLNTVQKEFNEDKKYSASTIESLISMGVEYNDIIDTETGLFKDVSTLLKELTMAKREDEIQTLKNTRAEYMYQRAYYYHNGVFLSLPSYCVLL